MHPGTIVKATYGRRNPATGIEHTGVVLDECDPDAWAGSIAFPTPNPDPVAIARHVAWLRGQKGYDASSVAVRWSFGRVYWELSINLVAVEDEEESAE